MRFLFLLSLGLFTFYLKADSFAIIKSVNALNFQKDKSIEKLISRGNIHFENGEYELALKNYNLALEKDPNNASLHFKSGVCYYKLNNDVQAKIEFEKAYGLDKNVDKSILDYLGLTNHLTGDFKKAISFLNEYLNSGQLDSLAKANCIKQINECNSALILKSLSDTTKELKIIGNVINSNFDESSFVILNDSIMYFTSDKPSDVGVKSEDIYFSFKKDNNWQTSVNTGKPINTLGSDAVLALLNNGKRMLIYSDINGGDIYLTDYLNNKWTKPVSLSDSVNTPFFESSIFVSKDEQSGFLVSNRPDGQGGKDLYSIKKQNNKWLKPVNLGAVVNSSYDEESPFLKGDTLYFSSKGHNSVGGYDVFYSCLKNGNWTKPVNIGMHVNSPYDEVSYAKYTLNEFVVTNKDGNANIFEIADVKKELSNVLAKETVKEIKDTLAEKFTNGQSLDLESLIGHKPVIFGFNEYKLTESAIKEIKIIADFIAKNPKLNLEIDVYTDCRGTDEYNIALSNKRANSIVTYLIEHHMIEKDRVIGVGKGESKLLVDCNCDGIKKGKSICTDVDHSKNRRAEFKVYQK